MDNTALGYPDRYPAYPLLLMQFRISHILTCIFIVSTAFAVRSATSFAQDYDLILVLSVAVSSILAFMMPFLGSTIRSSIKWSILVSTIIVAIHIIECLLRTEATKYIWVYAAGGDEILIYLLFAIITLIASLVATTISATLGAFIVNQLKHDSENKIAG